MTEGASAIRKGHETMIVGGYTLDLYCDNAAVPKGELQDLRGHSYDEFPHQFHGESSADTTRAARKKGWRVNWKKMTALCPKCSGKRLCTVALDTRKRSFEDVV